MAGTVTASGPTRIGIIGNQQALTLEWTSSSGGEADYTASSATYTKLTGYYLVAMKTVPGSGLDAPSASYDVTVVDSDGLDLMSGKGVDRSSTDPELVYPSVIAKSIPGAFLVHVDNAGNAKTGTIILFFDVAPQGGVQDSATFTGTLGAGTAVIGSVGIDQTTPGTTNGVQVTNLTTDSAHGATYTEAPIGLGAFGAATSPAVVDDGDKVRLLATLDGRLLVSAGVPDGDRWSYHGEVTDTTWTAIKAGAANYYLVCTFLLVQNSHASVGTVFYVYEDANGDVTDAVKRCGGYAAPITLGGGGFVAGNGNGPIFVTKTAANGLYFVAATTGTNCHVTAFGYRTKIVPAV